MTVVERVLIFQIFYLAAANSAIITHGNSGVQLVHDLDGTMELITNTSNFLRTENSTLVEPYIPILKRNFEELKTDVETGVNAIGFVLSDKFNRTVDLALLTIARCIAQLEHQTNEKEVKDIQGFLQILIDQFEHPYSKFRNYPLIAVRPLFSITTFVAVFHRVMMNVAPEIENARLLPCKIANTLRDYRLLAVHARMAVVSITNVRTHA